MSLGPETERPTRHFPLQQPRGGFCHGCACLEAGSVSGVHVAAVQFASSADTRDNLVTIRRLAGPLVDAGVELVVLPEASQRAFGAGRDDRAPGAEPLDGRFVSGLVDVAGDATIMAGMFERSSDGGQPFNSTVVVDGNGLRGVYRKIHLYDALGFAESDGIQPGAVGNENLVVVDVAGHAVGVLTCFDLRFPELSTALVAQGAEVLAIGAAWVPGVRKRQQFETLLGARAIEGVCFVVGAAQPGPRYCGRTQIVGPDGSVIVRLGNAGDHSVTATLDLATLPHRRSAMPMQSARRLDGAP